MVEDERALIYGRNASSPNLEGNNINKISEEDSYLSNSDRVSNRKINASEIKAEETQNCISPLSVDHGLTKTLQIPNPKKKPKRNGTFNNNPFNIEQTEEQ